ncbi:uncharacterized protein FFB14_13741 [Fusarium fujikuroi]|nr:uncharacterized protein FFB14_13741 [Fusarium fujikuroi]
MTSRMQSAQHIAKRASSSDEDEASSSTEADVCEAPASPTKRLKLVKTNDRASEPQKLPHTSEKQSLDGPQTELAIGVKLTHGDCDTIAQNCKKSELGTPDRAVKAVKKRIKLKEPRTDPVADAGRHRGPRGIVHHIIEVAKLRVKREKATEDKETKES